MFEFLTAAENVPFTVALAVMFIIAFFEGITTVFGVALSAMLDALLPDVDVPDAGVGLDASLESGIDGIEVQSPSPLSRLLSWLRIGKVPALMLLVVFLTAFGLIGLTLQSLTDDALGFLWPAWIAWIPVALLSLPVVRLGGGVLARIMPRDETEAVSVETLVGRVATITIGVARQGRPAEARVRDLHGTNHYVMVEPAEADAQFPAGSQVLLLQRSGAVFRVIANPSASLVDASVTEDADH